MNKVLCLLVLLAVAVSASLVPLSERNDIPTPWVKGQAAPLNAQFEFKVFLTQRNVEQFKARVTAMSDPDSEHWLQFLTIDQINDIVAPEPHTVAPVFTWLKTNGVPSEQITNYRDSLLVKTTIGVATKLFSTKFFTFTADQSGKTVAVYRQFGSSFVPAEVKEVVDIFVGIDDFPVLKGSLPIRAVPAPVVDQGIVVPSVLRNVYGLPKRSVVNPQTAVGLIEFQNDASFSPVDLRHFQERTDSIGTAVTKIVGPFNDASPDLESTLDVQYATAIADNTTIWFWTVTGWLLDFSQAFYNSKEVPSIISISWGWTDNQQCAITNCNGGSSQAYVARVNNEWSKIAGRGVSIFASSGDDGAYGPTNGYCESESSESSVLGPLFPTSSDFVTSVGATMLLASASDADYITESSSNADVPPICKTYSCSTSTLEGVCSYPQALITSGGGFSNYIATPDWQKEYVSKYLSSGVALPPAATFNRTGRAFPDISALGHNYYIYAGGSWQDVDGTSCSSPVMAAMLALVNDKRNSAGKKSIGFLAPLLYKLAASNEKAFRDVVQGNNKCTEGCCGSVGYVSSKTKGWDPVTGLGTPNFSVFESYLVGLA